MKKTKEILEDWCQKILEVNYEEVLKITEKYKDRKFKNCIVNIYNYILQNKDIIDYLTYLANNYFIGSGGIESSNKCVVQARLKLPGAKWDRIRAQYILSLSAKFYSEQWNVVETMLLDFFR